MKNKKWRGLLFVFVFLFVFFGLGTPVLRAETQTLSYEVELRAKKPDDYRLFWTTHTTYSLENLNDGDPETIAQIEYHAIDGSDAYGGGDLLKDSFYIILDLGAVYDLNNIAICWFPNGGRCYKYNVEISQDDQTYQKAADHSANVTEKDTITDSLSGKSGRYIRIEVFGNYRESDQTHSEFFPTSEMTVTGTLSAHQPDPTPTPSASPDTGVKRLDYEPTLWEESGNSLNWTSAYPIENINDGDLGTVVQAVYGGWYDEKTGLLDEPFSLILDLGAVYDLERIQFDWFLKGDKYYMYRVLVSNDDKEYTLCADHSDNTRPGTIVDTLEDVSCRYVQFEILGNYMPGEQLSNEYYAIYDLAVYGTYSANQPTEKPATPTPEGNPNVSTASPTPAASSTAAPGSPRTNAGLYWGIGIGAVLLIAAGVAVFFILKRKRSA